MDTMLRKALGKYNRLRQQVDNVLLGEDGDVWEKELKKFLAKRPCWGNVRAIALTSQDGTKKEPHLNTLIHVDRSIRPVYPNWATLVLRPELESVGPSDYDLAQIKLWLHDGQKNGGTTTGDVVYVHLEQNDMLKTCLGLTDLLAIQQKGIKTFWKVFGAKAVFGWKSVVRDRNGSRYHVPYVYDGSGGLVVGWRRLDLSWNGRNPAARFAS